MGGETNHAETFEEEMEELPENGDNEENDLNMWKHVIPELNVSVRIRELWGWPYTARARVNRHNTADHVCISPCISQVKIPIISKLHCTKLVNKNKDDRNKTIMIIKIELRAITVLKEEG